LPILALRREVSLRRLLTAIAVAPLIRLLDACTATATVPGGGRSDVIHSGAAGG
jgi:hypothetical protein